MSRLSKIFVGIGCFVGVWNLMCKTSGVSAVDGAGYLVFSFVLLLIGGVLIGEAIRDEERVK